MSYNYNNYQQTQQPYSYNQQPSTGGIQNLRNASIQSLLAPDVGAVEVRRGFQYEVDVFTQTGFQFKLSISLPDQFPQSPPIIKTDRAVWHSWVDENSNTVTGATDIHVQNWNHHCSLGRIVKNMQTSLFNAQPGKTTHQQRPPQQQQQQQQHQQPIHSITPTPATNFGYANPPVHPKRAHLPSVPSEYSQLSNMTMTQLQELVDSDAKFLEFFMALPQVKEMEKTEEDLRDDNVLLAQSNLSQEPELVLLKERLAEKHALIAQKQQVYDVAIQKQHELAQKFTPAALENHLEDAYNRSKSQANDIAERFQRGDEKDVQSFCQSYKEASKLAHMRKIKLQKLKQQFH